MLIPLLQNNVLGGAIPPVFVGPNYSTLTLVQNQPMTPRNYSTRFTEVTGQDMTFTLNGSVPGLSLSSAGVLTGTPTNLGTTAVSLTAEDEDTDTVDSNTFNIVVVASGTGNGDIGGGNLGGADIGGPDVGGSDVDTPSWWID
jgi:hypothetical protein